MAGVLPKMEAPPFSFYKEEVLGSLAAKGLMGLFALVHAKPDDVLLQTTTMQNMINVTFTLVAIGIGLIIPTLVYPQKQEH